MDAMARSTIEAALVVIAIEATIQLMGDLLVAAFVGLVIHQASRAFPKNWADAQDGFENFLWERWHEERNRYSSRLWAFCRLVWVNWQLIWPSKSLAAIFSDSYLQDDGRGSPKLRVAGSSRPYDPRVQGRNQSINERRIIDRFRGKVLRELEELQTLESIINGSTEIFVLNKRLYVSKRVFEEAERDFKRLHGR